MTERWVQSTKRGSFRLPDGSWGVYMIGLYDSRDIMSDCVKPIWERSGEYQIEIMKPNTHDNSEWEFKVVTNKEWGNKIAYNIQQGRFKNIYELEEALRTLGKSKGKYISLCGRQTVRIGLN